MSTTEFIEGLVVIGSANQKNAENRYFENIDYYHKYIDLLKENQDLETEKENYKFDLTKYQEILEPTYNEKIRKLKEKIKIIAQEKDFYFDNLNKYQKEIEPKYKEQINSLTQDLYNQEEKVKVLRKQLEEGCYTITRDLERANERHNSDKERINNLEKELKQSNDYAEKKTIELETDVRSKVVMIEAIEKLNRELEVKNANVRKEATLYQSALSDALIFRSSDEDSAQLSVDINYLQDKLEKYVTTLKGSSIKIDNDKIRELYREYNLDTQNTKDKFLMKSILQRYVLKTILECVDNHLVITNDDEPNISYNQEKYIINHTNELIKLLEKFYNDHFEKDNYVIKAIPTKIRQQIYGMLSKFGFSEIYENDQVQYLHPFISSTALEINQLMAGYRYIKDDNKRKNVEEMAEDLIKDIVRIFKFRLLVQEPKCETRWFKKNVKINTKFMEGEWDGDCLNDYVVDMCYFPLIGTELNDLSKSKVCIHAKVFPRFIAPLPIPVVEDHSPLTDEPQENPRFKDSIKDLLKYVTPATSSSITSSQNSAIDKRQSPTSSNHNSDLNKRQNSASSVHIIDKITGDDQDIKKKKADGNDGVTDYEIIGWQ